MKSAPCIRALLFFVSIPYVESYVNWDGDGNWKGTSNWSEIPEGIFVGPGAGSAQGTDFCDVVRDKSHPLKDALGGRNLSIAVQYGPGFDFFQYNPNEELSRNNPTGMIANVLDELASRAGFSWRNSFVAYNTTTVDELVGKGSGKWDRMLKETTSFFDLSVDKWLLTTRRLENETVFLNSWFDASLILVDEGDQPDINWTGFAAPFEGRIWLAILTTVLMSAFFMITIESLEDRRDGRSMKSWISDHLYLTFLAFCQQFLFINPVSTAGRVFLSSFAFWAMLIGATYTANLASLLVENALTSPVKSIESAMNAKLSICIHEGSASQTIMESFYPAFKGYPKLVKTGTTQEMYDRLTEGECEILIGTRQEYEIYRREKKYGCNLVQAGVELHEGAASFAIEFDPLNCDSVLAYVLNIHLHAIAVDGNMTNFWNDYLNNHDRTCEKASRRRMMEIDDEDGPPHSDPMASRQLKGGGGSAAASSSNAFSEESISKDESLKITGMAGVFAVHGVGTVLAILIAIFSHARKWQMKEQARQKQLFGIDSSMVAKNEVEEKYEALKLNMLAQMDMFFEEHKEGIHRKSEIQMRSIIDMRQSQAMVRNSVFVSPSTSIRQARQNSDLDVSGRSFNSSIPGQQNSSILESLQLDPLGEYAHTDSENEGKSQTRVEKRETSQNGLSGDWKG